MSVKDWERRVFALLRRVFALQRRVFALVYYAIDALIWNTYGKYIWIYAKVLGHILKRQKIFVVYEHRFQH